MPPNRSGRRRRRHHRHRHGLIARSRPSCTEEDATSVQKPCRARASSIIATSSSWPQSQTLAQDTMNVPPAGSSVSCVLARLEFDWGYTVYIRLDRQGSFHTYPDLGGPYRSLQEVDEAIDRHLDELRDPKMFVQPSDASTMDAIIRQSLYWPDGTSRRSKSCAMQKSKDQNRRLVQALLDKYNEDYHLLGDLAYELSDFLRGNSISEDKSWYYHLNFSAHSKARDDSDNTTNNLFFAEVKHLNRGKHREVFVCCFCIVNPIDEGQHCNACTFDGNFGMKHPDSSIELAAGHLDPRSQFGGHMKDIEWNDSEDEDKCMREAEAEVRRMYKGLDDPQVIERLFTLPPGVTIVQD
ncbi:unnamed protein product [Urochloa humidicola]